MKSIVLPLLAALALAGCGDPVAEASAVDARYSPNRADSIVAVEFAPGSARLDPAQDSQLRAMVSRSRPDSSGIDSSSLYTGTTMEYFGVFTRSPVPV